MQKPSLNEAVNYSVKNRSDAFKNFQTFLNQSLPTLARYITRRINIAHATGVLYFGELNPVEILDIAYLELFKRLEKTPLKDSQLKTFIYSVVDEVLEKELREKQYEATIFVNLNRLLAREIFGMEERFTVDGNGKVVLTEDIQEDLGDSKYYNLLAVLPQDNGTAAEIEKALLNIDKRVIHQEIRKQLIRLPEIERSIFDLFWLEEMSLPDIAKIRKIDVTEVELILKSVTSKVKKGLEERLTPK